jgi:hypothetical protein
MNTIAAFDGKDVSLTTDNLASTATEGYLGVTVHFIDNNWQMEANILTTRAMKERRTGVNIAQELQQIIDKFNIKKSLIRPIVTDNAANMALACTNMEVNHVGCFANTLQLAVEDGLKLPQICPKYERCCSRKKFETKDERRLDEAIQARRIGRTNSTGS